VFGSGFPSLARKRDINYRYWKKIMQLGVFLFQMSFTVNKTIAPPLIVFITIKGGAIK
jgi:hypothetical protein